MTTSPGGTQRLLAASTTQAAAPTGESPRAARGGGDKACVVLVDPRPLTRASVVDLLTRLAGNFSVSPVSSAADLPGGDSLDEVQLVIFNVGAALLGDAWVNAEFDAIDKHVPRVPLILLSDCEDINQVAKALRLGVRGYIPTTFSPTVAVEAMRLVHAGGTFVPANAVRQSYNGDVGVAGSGVGGRPADQQSIRLEANPPARSREGNGAGSVQSLTPRQHEVLHLLCEGKPNKVIAHALGMQEGTVKVHVRQIMKKLRATNRTQVAFLANRGVAETKNGA